LIEAKIATATEITGQVTVFGLGVERPGEGRIGFYTLCLEPLSSATVESEMVIGEALVVERGADEEDTGPPKRWVRHR
jgi:hypothetical protein